MTDKAPTIQEQYDRTRLRVTRMGTWLTGPKGDALSEEEWNERFALYQDELAKLRRLGDLLKPRLISGETILEIFK